MAEEHVITAIVDPDFGPIELVETHTLVGVNGGPMQPLVFRTWRRVESIEGPRLLISDGGNPPYVSLAARTDYKRYAADIDGLKAEVAQRQLQLAKDWAASGDIGIDLDGQSFAKVLELDGYSIDPNRVTVWLKDTADIFAGHQIEVIIENGAIAEICLAG